MKHFVFCFFLLALVACGSSEAVDASIAGHWQGITWTQGGAPVKFPSDRIKFHFEGDKTFKAEYGDQIKTGSFRTRSDNKVFLTDQDNKTSEFSIEKQGSDTLMLKIHVGMGTFDVFTLQRQR